MRSNNWLFALAITTALSALPIIAHSADSDKPAVAVPNDTNSVDNSGLLNLSLQQLSDVEVTSVSKKAEKASQAAAAVYVITQEDIRRSGLQNVPELLRMVPGLQVAQTGSNGWAISSRGFDGQFANKLLVMIDGRTVYTPVFGGTWWDVQNVMLEDVERIEVIRGPGATLWGANAVNGVINIITKSTKDTQGTLLTAAAGNLERTALGARYGGTDGNLSYRTYAQYFNDNQQNLASTPAFHVAGGGADDQWHNSQGGFRLDWSTSEKEQQTLQGDVYQGVENSLRFLPTTSSPYLSMVNDTDDVSGMNVLGRVTHELSAGSNITFQAYYDDVNREAQFVNASEHTQTLDFDFQHNWTLNSYNDVTWGLGYRRINSDFGNGFDISFSPENQNDNLYSAFLQDKVSLIQDKLFLTLGSKIEHNDFSGFEYEPSARISWIPTPNQTVWASVSRAVHAPDQTDQNLNLALQVSPPFGPHNTGDPFPALFSEKGTGSVDSEDLLAYELGYRIQPKENISLDATAFLNEYTNLISLTTGSPTLVGTSYVLVPEVLGNANSGETHGVEFAATWEVTKRVKLSGGYSVFYEALHLPDPSSGNQNGTAPKQQFNARAYVDLTHNLQWDTMAYYVDSIPTLNTTTGTISIPAYTRLDTRLGWTPFTGVDLSLIGQNLLQSEHQEFGPALYQTNEEIGRSGLVKLTVRF